MILLQFTFYLFAFPRRCLHWLLSRSEHRYYYLAIDEVRPICGTADLDNKVYRVHEVLIRYLGAA